MADPLRVLELVVSTEPGGGPAHVHELVSRLPREDFEVTVAGPGGGAYAERFRKEAAAFVDVPADRLSLRALVAVRRLLVRRRIGLVHSHGKGAGLYGRLAARWVGVPAIHTFHGIHYAGYPAGARAAYLALERLLGGMSATVVHVSESQAREAAVLGLCPPGRTRVIANGVDAERIRAGALPRDAARAALGLEPGTLVLGTVARLDPVKALDVLLEAFARVSRAQPAVHLVVIGDGPEAGRLRALARTLGVDARVRFAGLVADASRLLPAIDVYVSASRREGLPLSLLEAMALGLPVVATRVPGHVDVVAEGVTGLLAAQGDPAGLAEALGALLADAARRETMGEAGRRHVENRFRVEQMVAETATLYRETVARFHEGKSSTPGV